MPAADRPAQGFSAPRLLITGAAGFLGQALLRQMPAGWHVAALVRDAAQLPCDPFCGVFESTEALLEKYTHFDAVLHLAARIPRRPAADGLPPEDLDAVNAGLPSALLAAYPGARHVLASSVAVYGHPRSLPLSLATAPRPDSAYGRSKLAAEAVVRRAPRHAIIRFSSLIGVGMRPGSFIPTVAAAARAGRIRLLGDGRRRQNYLDVEDAAAMCVAAVRAQQSALALGVGPRSYSNREVAEILAALTGAGIVHEGEDASPSFVYSTEDSALFAEARIDLATTLRKMINV